MEEESGQQKNTTSLCLPVKCHGVATIPASSSWTATTKRLKNSCGKFVAALAGQKPADGLNVDTDDYLTHQYKVMVTEAQSGDSTRVDSFTPTGKAPADAPFARRTSSASSFSRASRISKSASSTARRQAEAGRPSGMASAMHARN